MKKILSLVFLLLAAPAFGQSATLTAPVTFTNATKYVVQIVHFERDCVCATITLELQDATGAVKNTTQLSIPADVGAPGTEFLNFLTAMGSPATGETGGIARKMNFRILRYLTVTYPRIGATPNP